MTDLVALGIQQPQINTIGNFMASQNAATQQKSAVMQQQEAAHTAIAEHALGVMGGRLDGPVDPEALKQWMGDLNSSNDPHAKALAAQLQANPNLVPVLAKGSLAVLAAGQDQAKLDLAQKQYEMELQKARFQEVAPGATLHDVTGQTPDFTAPNRNPTGTLGEYQFYADQEKAAGREPLSLLDYQQAVKGNGVTIGPDGTVQIGGPGAKGINAYDTAEAKRLVDLNATISDGGRTATSQLATLNKMRDLLSNDKVYSGIGSDQVQQLQKFATVLGADPSGIRDTETFAAMAKKSVLDLANGSLGTGFSNGDRDFMVGQVPDLANTKAGNLELIDTLQKIAQHKKDIAAFTADYKKAHGGRLDSEFDGALADWAEKNPAFPDTAASGASGDASAPKAPPVGTIDEYNGVKYRFKGGDPTDKKNWEAVH